MSEFFTARIAEAYGSHSGEYASILEPILRPMANEIMGMGKLEGGELVLDLATGTGLIARSAAQFTNFIVGIDISLGMLERAQGLSAGEIPFVMGNASRLPFIDGRFDLVTCGLSLSHFSDGVVALGEVRRVLRPRGRFITSAWGTEGQNPSKEAAVAVRKRFLEDREDVLEGKFSEEIWAHTERGSETLRQAGFADVRVTSRLMSGEYRDQADAVETALAWPLTRYRIALLDDKVQQRLREETAAAILKAGDLHWQSEIHYYEGSRPGDSG
jgi:ubiquinone/menaquinone biosynthesis C-methylase UbiE